MGDEHGGNMAIFITIIKDKIIYDERRDDEYSD